MTKNEAFKIAKSLNMIDAYALVSSLEALGLIKFDEENHIDSPSMVIKNEIQRYADQPMIRANKIIDALYAAGYKIVYPEKPK